jgi:hypothetical protein
MLKKYNISINKNLLDSGNSHYKNYVADIVKLLNIHFIIERETETETCSYNESKITILKLHSCGIKGY